jgi:chitin deacetylase
MKKRILIVIAVLIVLISMSFGLYKLMKSRSYQVAGELIDRVDTNEKVVYLTFDDGPTERTPEIIDLLDDLDVKATFFLIGSNIEENPDYAKMIIENGHDVGNHTYSHCRMVFKSPTFVKNEVDKTNDLIRDI